MSDTGRKGLSDQVKETVTPESQKSTGDKIGETVTDATDKVAASVQPGDSKSTTQKLSDETRAGANDAQSSGQGYLAQAQDAASGLAKSAQDTINNLTGGNIQETGQKVLSSVQQGASTAFDTASKAATDLANSISGSGASTDTSTGIPKK